MKSFFTYFFVSLSVLMGAAYTASPPPPPSLPCTFQPGMSKSLEVLAYLDEDYRENSTEDKAFAILTFIRTGSWEGMFKDQRMTFKGLRYGKPANAQERCLMYKALIRSNVQAYNHFSLKNAKERIQWLAKQKKHQDVQHQLTVLIISMLTHLQRTVDPSQVTKNIQTLLIEALDEMKMRYSKEKLKKMITSIWQSHAFQAANAIVKGEQRAALALGQLSEEAAGKALNEETKRQYYKQARSFYYNVVQQGNYQAQYPLGALYAKGLGIARKDIEDKLAVRHLMKSMGKADRTKAVSRLQEMAKAGKVLACVALSKIFEKGLLGVPQNQQQAILWLDRAARQNDPRSQYKRALHFMMKGPLKNETEAIKWLTRAAEQDYAQAQYKLGLFYLQEGPRKNIDEALKWLLKASGQKHSRAEKKLKEIDPSKASIPLSKDNKATSSVVESGTMITTPQQNDPGGYKAAQ